MAPILRVMSDGSVRGRSEITEAAAADVGLSSADREIILSTGQYIHANRVGWAISHLTGAGALARPNRGHYVIAEPGAFSSDLTPQ
jgi:restriction system protein